MVRRNTCWSWSAGPALSAGLLALFWLLYLTLLPTERRWSEADVLLAFTIPVFLTIGACLVLRERLTAVTACDIIVALWSIYYVGRTWYGGEFFCRTEFLKAMEVFLLYYSLRLFFSATRPAGWQLVVFILVGGCYEAVLGVFQMYEGTGRHHLFALTGSFQNPGPYSAYIMMGVTVGLVSLQIIRHKDIRLPAFRRLPCRVVKLLQVINIKHFLLAAVITMIIILPATWSRAAFLGVIVVAFWIYRRYYWKYRLMVLCILLFLGLLFYYIKQGSADGRLIIWQAALAAWIEIPWLGAGTGGFCHALAEGMARLSGGKMDFMSAGVADTSYNILLKILVEQGVVGVVFAVLLTTFALKSLYRNSWPLFYGIVSLLVFAMFSYPFEQLPYKIITVMVIAWSESRSEYNMCRMRRITVVPFLVFMIFFGGYIYKAIRKSYGTDLEYVFMKGRYDKELITSYYELLPLESDNPEYLFDIGKMLRTAGRYNDSNAMLWRGTQCSADPMFYVLMGNNYKDMAHYDLAEQSYKKAFAVMPNRLYPLYRLMLLYEQTGEQRKMGDMAKQIVSFKVKVASPATKKMKEEAEAILKRKQTKTGI